MIRKTEAELDVVINLCKDWGPKLELRPGEPSGIYALFAIFLNEHYDEHNCVPRLEKGYCPGGRWFNDRLWKLYGEDSAKSYSNWQLMFSTACELGFRGTPQDLDDDATAIRSVVEYLNRRVIHRKRAKGKAVTLADLLDGYNTGDALDNIHNPAYVHRGEEHYAEAEKKLGEAHGTA